MQLANANWKQKRIKHDIRKAWFIPWLLCFVKLKILINIIVCLFSFTRYKCHKECVQYAPSNCGFSEGKLRRVIDNTDIQNALGK